MKNIRSMPDGSYVDLDKVVMIGKMNYDYLQSRAFCEILLEGREEPIEITLAYKAGEIHAETKSLGDLCLRSIVSRWSC